MGGNNIDTQIDMEIMEQAELDTSVYDSQNQEIINTLNIMSGNISVLGENLQNITAQSSESGEYAAEIKAISDNVKSTMEFTQYGLSFIVVICWFLCFFIGVTLSHYFFNKM